ncbi:heavy metal translocating P-type ATPase [Deltaproteobacteria bacterium TL4]
MFHVVIIVGGLAYAGYKAHKENLSKQVKPTSVSVPVSAHVALTQVQSQLVPVQHEPKVIGLTDAEINHYLKVSASALGLSVLGSLAYPPLSLLSIPLLIYTALPIFKNAFTCVFAEHRIRSSVVDSIAIVGALGTQYYVAGSLATVVLFLGGKLLLKTEDKSKKELIDIFDQRVQSVWLLRGETEVEIPFEDLKPGDVIALQAGEMIPIDGTILKGMASVDQSNLTGEAQPVEKQEGDIIFASTIMISGKIFARVEYASSETTAAKIACILQNTADFKSSVNAKVTQLADMMATPTLALGGVALTILGPVSATAMVSCNFMETANVNIPLGVLNFLKITSEKGILVKDGRCLELLQEVDTVVFDKTGTLTLEEPEIGRVYILNGLSSDTIMEYAATAEHKQSHPIAKAILKYAKDHKLTLPGIEDSQYEVGYGIKVRVAQKVIHVGSDRFMDHEAIAGIHTERVLEIQNYANHHGYALLYVGLNQCLVGVIELHVTIRPEAKHVVELLKSRGLETYIISGDNQAPTRKLAEELGINHYFFKVLPQDKARIIQELQAQGKSTCFVGDGINDTVALKASNVSISIQGASTAAIDTAGIVLMDHTLNHLPILFEIAQEMEQSTRRGFGIALIPGAIGVAGVFLFHFKIYASLILYIFSLATGTLNAMIPALKHKKARPVKLLKPSPSNKERELPLDSDA